MQINSKLLLLFIPSQLFLSTFSISTSLLFPPINATYVFFHFFFSSSFPFLASFPRTKIFSFHECVCVRCETYYIISHDQNGTRERNTCTPEWFFLFSLSFHLPSFRIRDHWSNLWIVELNIKYMSTCTGENRAFSPNNIRYVYKSPIIYNAFQSSIVNVRLYTTYFAYLNLSLSEILENNVQTQHVCCILHLCMLSLATYITMSCITWLDGGAAAAGVPSSKQMCVVMMTFWVRSLQIIPILFFWLEKNSVTFLLQTLCFPFTFSKINWIYSDFK